MFIIKLKIKRNLQNLFKNTTNIKLNDDRTKIFTTMVRKNTRIATLYTSIQHGGRGSTQAKKRK